MGTTRLSAESGVKRGLSPEIWQGYGFIGGVLGDPSLFPFYFNDFALFPTMASATEEDGHITYQDTGVTIKPATDVDNSEGEFGLVEIAGNDADNDEGHLEFGGAVGGLVRIDPTAGEGNVVAFEARIKKASVADNACAVAVGIGEPGFAAADGLVDDTGALADKDFVGFQTLHASGEEIDTVFRVSGGSVVQVKDNAGTMVADTWIKLGFVYDPRGATNKKLRFFIDGVELTDYPTDAVIDGSTFPKDEEMLPILLTKVGAAAESKVFIDWWAVGSYLVD